MAKSVVKTLIENIDFAQNNYGNQLSKEEYNKLETIKNGLKENKKKLSTSKPSLEKMIQVKRFILSTVGVENNSHEMEAIVDSFLLIPIADFLGLD